MEPITSNSRCLKNNLYDKVRLITFSSFSYSFDIASLFTNHRHHHTNNQKYCKFSKSNFRSMLEVACREPSFIFMISHIHKWTAVVLWAHHLQQHWQTYSTGSMANNGSRTVFAILPLPAILSICSLRENLYQFYSLREKVFTIKKILFKSKNRVFTFKKWVFKVKK